MAKSRPRTGERRSTNQPFKIDRLPGNVQDEILRLRNQRGKTWLEIEALSAEPVKLEDGTVGSGFIDWPALPFEVLELFPDMRLPHSSLHRWYDVRVDQVRKDVQIRSKQALKIAESFAKSQLVNGDEAVINAARDTLMGVLAEDGSEAGRLNAVKGLLKLGEVMQKARTNEIRDRKVATDERKVEMLEKRERLAIRKLEAETEKVAKKVERGEVTVADINRIRERTFGLPPVQKAG